MTIIEAVTAGVVQGITEFLPVSSSGHLVLVHKFFGFGAENDLFFDVCLHVATLLAVLVYFYRDIMEIFAKKNVKLVLLIIVATIPAALAGFFLEDRVKILFEDLRWVAYFFIATAFTLFLGQAFLKNAEEKGTAPGWVSAIVVGVAQTLALLPGVSRSGMTVSAGLVSGMKPREAFRFSFLLSIPIILGAALYETIKTDLSTGSGEVLFFAAGIIAAFIAGILSLRLLWFFVAKRKLYLFGIYCFLLGLSGIVFWAR